MKRLLQVVLPLFAIASLSACEMEFGGGGGKDEWKKPPPPVTVVEVQAVERGDVADLLLASAAVEAEAEATLLPKATGMVIEVRKDVGDPVRKGDVLAVLDNVQLDAGAERAQAEVRHLESKVAEMERLHTQGAVSDRELEDLRFQLATARTGLREASKTAGETRLTAPFDGVVASRDVRMGEMASAGARAFSIVDLSELRVRANLPERDVARVRLGQTARLVSSYDPDQTGTATVTRLSPVIDPASGTFQVTLTLDPGGHGLRPGQFVSVELEVARHEGVVVVPKEAVVYDNGAPVAFVYVEAPPEEEAEPDESEEGVGEPEKAEDDAKGDDDEPKEPPGPKFMAKRVPLELGLTDTRLAEVVSGLSVGDLVVTVGQSNLRDGSRVRLPRDEEATPRDAAAKRGDAEPTPGDEG